MTRQLVDVLEVKWDGRHVADRLVASLLTDGPAEHTIVCPTCEGDGWRYAYDKGVKVRSHPCPDCTNGRQTVIVRAEVKRG